jgi:hypothetical protein
MTGQPEELRARNSSGDDHPVTEAAAEDHGHRWAAWVRRQLAGRRQKWLVEASQGRIGAPQVSRWLNRGERPRADVVVLVADLFEASRQEALREAGYGHLAASFDDAPVTPRPLDPVVREILGKASEDLSPTEYLALKRQEARTDPLVREILSMDIPDAAKYLVLRRRDSLVAELRELMRDLRGRH